MGDIEQIRKQMPPLLEDILVRWWMFYNPNMFTGTMNLECERKKEEDYKGFYI